MKVWIVNPFDNLPMEGFRPQRYWLMARAFVRAGHEVVYWTGDFSHATKRRREFLVDVDDGFAVEMVGTSPYRKNVCLSRVASHRRLARDWVRLARMRGDKPDVVIASMPPLGLCAAARSYAERCGAFFVADVQDAWPETFERVLPRFLLSLCGLRRAAKRIYLQADAVSAVAKRYIDLARGYGSRAPAAVFGHAIERKDSPFGEKCKDGVFRLAYIGNMSMSYDLETLVRCVSGMEGVTLDIAGNGPDRRRIETLAVSVGGTNISFHPYLAKDDLARLLSSCDAGVIPMFPDSCVGIPGKTADYATAGLKIIECLGGETAALVDRFGAGAHYRAGDIASLRKAIDILKARSGDWKAGDFAKSFDAVEIMDGYVEWVLGIYSRLRNPPNTDII